MSWFSDLAGKTTSRLGSFHNGPIFYFGDSKYRSLFCNYESSFLWTEEGPNPVISHEDYSPGGIVRGFGIEFLQFPNADGPGVG